MTEKEFLNKLANTQGDFIQELLNLLEEDRIPFCLIGGLAVNAYAEPVVSLDLDLVVLADRVDELVTALEKRFSVTRHKHSINVNSPQSDIRVQIQSDPRYQPFIARSTRRKVLGYDLPVASIEDVLQGKVWAYSDTERRPSKRQKDLSDIMRLVEAHPELAELLPDSLRNRIEG